MCVFKDRLLNSQGQVQILELLISNKLSYANYKTSLNIIYLFSLNFCFLTDIIEFITNYNALLGLNRHLMHNMQRQQHSIVFER